MLLARSKGRALTREQRPDGPIGELNSKKETFEGASKADPYRPPSLFFSVFSTGFDTKLDTSPPRRATSRTSEADRKE